MGLHTGMVVARELREWDELGPGYVVGSTPKTAAQLCALVQPGTVAVSEETRAPAAQALHPRARAPCRNPDAGHGTGRSSSSVKRATPRMSPMCRSWDGTGSWRSCSTGGAAPEAAPGRESSSAVSPASGSPGWLAAARRSSTANPIPGWRPAASPTQQQHPLLPPSSTCSSGMLDPSLKANPEAKLTRLEELLSRYGFELAEAMPLFTALLLPAHSRRRYAPLDVPAPEAA